MRNDYASRILEESGICLGRRSIIYFDDLIIIVTQNHYIEDSRIEMINKFEMSVLGLLTLYLVIKVA